jgi:GR25 family glycosyltransferase involved in LPS biosynthesis
MNKLDEFPSVYYITLEESTERQEYIKKQFTEYDIKPIPLKSKRYAESDDIIEGQFLDVVWPAARGVCASHLKAIKKWYNETEESYAFFCEDDVSLEPVKYWNFTWKEFVNALPNDWECVQLMWIKEQFDDLNFRERSWDDWSATAYILTRGYAKKLIDTYHYDDAFHLTVKDSTVYPVAENILFLNQGKVYGAPLFVEEVQELSTVAIEGEIIDGQAANHHESYHYVMNWWKNNHITLEKLMNISYDPIVDYAYDTENPQKNFNLARWYHAQKQTASAISYYLRAADRTEDLTLAYECLLHMASCFNDQGNRDYTTKGLYQHAISILPQRPEAYYLLSKFEEYRKQYTECYTTCSIALNLGNFDLEPLSNDVGYVGKYGLIFQKAVSSYWWGKSRECRELFLELKNNYNHLMDEDHRSSVGNNLMTLGCWVEESIKYEKSKYNHFKFRFDGLEGIEKSNGQALQDMFILSILNGKKNGTYLEIGAQEPIFQNNTAILEQNYDWKGVSVEIKQDLCNMFAEQRKNPILCKDALTIDYKKLLDENFDTTIIDYLQLDIEPSKNTFECLLAIPFEKYKFAVITYEHDYYVDMTETYRTKSRNYLKLMGYELVVSNVSQNENTPFEDWWVHPDLVDAETIEKFRHIADVTDVRTYFYS